MTSKLVWMPGTELLAAGYYRVFYVEGVYHSHVWYGSTLPEGELLNP